MDGLILKVGTIAGLASAGLLTTFVAIAIASWRRDRHNCRSVQPFSLPPSRSLRAAAIPPGYGQCRRCNGWVPAASLARHDRGCARRTAREAAQVDQFLREMGMAGADPVDVANAAHDELSGARRLDEPEGRA